ncbi:Spaetzle [Popillia japonica]|uniref:Spaetzle n=1 Tax=Popillia japonica TaxID=7064 RepID=A0AAW1J1N4_POPJA
MNHQVLYFIFCVVLFDAIQAARIDNSNRGGPLKTQYKRQIEGGCFHNMCNDTKDYPADEIRQFIEKTPGFKDLFGTVTKPYRPITLKSRLRPGDDDILEANEKNMCRTRTHYTTPKRAMDVDGVWQFVVNGEGMEQLIEYETCEEGASCDDEVQIPGQTVACRMQEITIRLFAFARTASGDAELQLKSFALSNTRPASKEGASCDDEVQIPGQTVACRMQEITIRLFAFARTASGDAELQLKSFALPAGCYCAAKVNNLRAGRQRIDD